MNATVNTPEKPLPSRGLPRREDSFARRAIRGLSFRNIGAVYVWLAIVVIFAIWVPSTFPTWATAKQTVNSNAATGLMALAIVIPLCTRTFDLSIGFVASLSAVTASYMINHGLPVSAAVAIALGAAVFVGLVNATVVVVMRVDSFIATLATGSLIQAFITALTNDIAITDPRLAGSFAKIGQASIGGIALPVIYTLIVATLIWFVLEHTATGRRLYATGFNPESARLAGVKTARLRYISLIVSATIAGVAGVVIASTVGSGDPQAGVPYLLSAYAAAFLGASQLRHGRFNAWGTLIAVLLLGTGVIGLALASAPNWAPSAFTGVVLIAALGITGAERRSLGSGWRQRFSRDRKRATSNVLVVAHQTAATPGLLEAVRERAQRGPARFHLVVPRQPRGEDKLVDRQDAGSDAAQQVLADALPKLSAAAGHEVTGSLGNPEPLTAIQDAIHLGHYDEIIISTLPLGVSRWLKLDLVSKARAQGLPVTHVQAPSTVQGTAAVRTS